jgi:uncharacterized membrane protein YraQ (UPF0718 family)
VLILQEIGNALESAGSMGWEILWPLILGFLLSGIIQSLIRTDQITKWMDDDPPEPSALRPVLEPCHPPVPTPL